MSHTTPHDNKENRDIPQHIGVIMDGNGRWAKKHNLNRSKGHINGIQPMKDSTSVALQYGVPFITFYIFSIENWKRPRQEINFILSLVAGNLRSHYKFYKDNNIKIVHSGKTTNLGTSVIKEINNVVDQTKNNSAITLNLAFNYSGRDEIIRSIKKYMNANKSAEKLTEQEFETYFDRPDIPHMDLLIRTGGVKRISNFFIWHAAYAELYFSDILWPDWKKEHMEEAIKFYAQQERRFGGITSVT